MKLKKKGIRLVYLILLSVIAIIPMIVFTEKKVISPIQIETRKDENVRDILDEEIEIERKNEAIKEELDILQNKNEEENGNKTIMSTGTKKNNLSLAEVVVETSSVTKIAKEKISNKEVEVRPHIDETTNAKYITYEDIGVAENEEDAYHILKMTHEIANQNGYEVRATLGEYHIYKLNDIEPIYIKTNTDWNNTNFIIHDEEIKDLPTKNYPIFEIISDEQEKSIINKEVLNKIKINKQTKQIKELAGYGNCLCIAYNANKKQYIRSGFNVSKGNSQLDLFKIDNNGNVLNEIQWDFDDITKIRMIPIPEKQIVIQNGNFQTNLDKGENEQISGYLNRNIMCNRSNTKLENINHRLNDEIKLGGPYFGFIRIEWSTNVEVVDCELVSHKYKNVSNYDLIIEYSTNIRLDKIISNYIEENDRWGIVGSNYTKDIIYNDCVLNRIDAHCGVHNLTINNCKVGVKGLTLVGSGKLKITNTTRIGGNSFIELRSDYGSTWNGSIEIENCKYEINQSDRLIAFKVIYDDDSQIHDYGYEKILPNVYINNLEIEDKNGKNEIVYIFCNDEYYTANKNGDLLQAGYILPKEIMVDNYNISKEKTIKAFYQEFEGVSDIKIKIDIPNRPKLEMKKENNVEYINGELTNEDIYLNLETKDKIQNEIQINGQAIEEKEAILKETGNYQIVVTSIDSAGNTIQDQYEVKIDKKPPTITGVEQNKIYDEKVTPKVEDENLDFVTLYYNEKIVEDYKINSQLTKEGKYQIEARDKAGNKTSIYFEIQHPDKIENITQYKVKEKYIFEILPSTTKQEFLKNATLNSKLKIYRENKEIEENEIVKTGDKIKINNESYTLIVRGDLSGDGRTNITDIMQVKRHIISKTEMTNEKKMAADINYDGKIDIKDVMLMIRMTISS